MQAGQAFLRGVGRFQAVLLAALGAVPGLAGVVDPSDVVGAWGEGTGVNARSIPRLCPRPQPPQLTYLVAQHPLQPVLPGSGQVDGQGGPAVLHHHHCLGQEVIGELHHHLQKKEEATVMSGGMFLAEGGMVADGQKKTH